MYTKHLEHVDKLNKAMEHDGAFLVVQNEQGKANVMTIGWATVGIIWGRPMITVFVRPVRYTYEILEHSQSFTICVPSPGKLKEELAFCGANSGRSIDKIGRCGFTMKKGQTKNTVVIEECKLFYECHIIERNNIDPTTLDASIVNNYYPKKDFHTVYYGEIRHSYMRK